MKYFLASGVFCLLTIAVVAQNLIRNGGFEDVECPDNPINSFTNSASWYAIGADAYWLHLNCPLDKAATATITAIKPNLMPYRGFGYISLEGVLTNNGVFVTEGIGIKLTETLQSGRYYYFEMGAMSYDLVKGPSHPGIDCDPIPERYLGVWLADRPITFQAKYTQIGPINLQGEVSLNAVQKLEDRTASTAGFKYNRWNTYWSCFAADGGETHLGVNGNIGKVMGMNVCIEDDEPGVLYIYGHGVDEVQLVAIPEKIDTILAMCPEGLQIDLENFISGPFVAKADFNWQDGYTGTERFIKSPGTYEVEMVLPCVTVPITLYVEKSPCLPNIFVPNVFSPNGDGVNDRLIPFVKTFLELSSYRFRVFNRWGHLVFQTDTFMEGWDGRFRNKLVEPGVYIWSMEYVLKDDPLEKRLVSGDVLVIR